MKPTYAGPLQNPGVWVAPKKSKCVFFQKELEFLGHHISKEGIRPTKSRVKAIQDTLSPSELSQATVVLVYNSKFMPSLSHTIHHLHQLLKKNSL